MTPELVLLLLAAACLLAAMGSGRRASLPMAIAFYAGVVVWLAHNSPDLLVPALGIAAGAEFWCLWRALWRLHSDGDVTSRHNNQKAVTNNRRRLPVNKVVTRLHFPAPKV